METQRLKLLTCVLITFVFKMTIANADPGLPRKINIQIVERASRIAFSAQSIDLDASAFKNSAPLTFPLKSGKALDGCKIKLYLRPVRVDSKINSLWIESSLVDRTGKTLAYTVLTTNDNKFSVGAGFDDPSNPQHKFIFMLDTISTDR